MKMAIADLVSTSPYSQSKHYDKLAVPPLSKELPDDYEMRTWRNRMHVNGDGYVFIPPMSFANSIKEAARRMSLKIPGQRNKTYTNSFAAGVMVTDPLVLGVKAADVEMERLFVPADGVPGSGKRVNKNFPLIKEWKGKVTYHVLDDLITQDVFRQTLAYSGLLVGIGRFRPQNRGFYGRFQVKSLQWQEAVVE